MEDIFFMPSFLVSSSLLTFSLKKSLVFQGGYRKISRLCSNRVVLYFEGLSPAKGVHQPNIRKVRAC